MTEALAFLAGITRDVGVATTVVLLFIGTLVLAQIVWGKWFEAYQEEAAEVRLANSASYKTMLALIEQMRAEITSISARLVECQKQHTEDRIMINAQETRLYRLQLAIVEKGIPLPK